MNLRDFKYICAVAEHNHFGKAARACNVSQPTLSSQIKKLEDYLGIQIFERTKRRTFLTPVGRDIIEIANKALVAEKEIRMLADLHRDPLSGELNIGLIPTVGSSLIPLLLPKLSEEYPKIDPVFVEATTEHILRQLNEGKIDFAIIASNEENQNYQEISLYNEPFWAAFPVNHVLNTYQEVEVKDLNKDELLLLCDGHCLRDQILEFCDLPKNWTPGSRAAMRATSIETIINLVAAGHGITLVPALAVKGGWIRDRRIHIRCFKKTIAKRQVRIIHRKGSHRIFAIKKIAESIQKIFMDIQF